MPRKAKNKTIRNKAKEEKIIESKPKVRKTATKYEELQFLGEWLAQEYLSVELKYDPLKEHHATRNNKLQGCDGKDPNGRSVEIRTLKRGGTFFVLTKEDIKAFEKAERSIICEYGDTNTISMHEVLDKSILEKNKQLRLPVRQIQLLLSFDNQEFAEKMREKG